MRLGFTVMVQHQRVDDLQKDVGQLETTLGGGIESASSSSVARSKRPYLKTSDCSSVISAGKDDAFVLVASIPWL